MTAIRLSSALKQAKAGTHSLLFLNRLGSSAGFERMRGTGAPNGYRSRHAKLTPDSSCRVMVIAQGLCALIPNRASAA